MIDELVTRAYRRWKENAGLLIAIGALSCGIPFVVIAVLSIFAVSLGITDPEAIPELAIIFASILAVTLMNAFVINGNYAIRKKIAPLSKSITYSASRILETGTAILFSTFPAIIGMVCALLVFTTLGESWSWLAVVLIIAGICGSVSLALSPYYAPDRGWWGAVTHAYAVGRKIYITLFLTYIFFVLIYITAHLLLANPSIRIIVFVLTDMVFLTHIKHQTFFEIIDSVEARE